METGLNRYLSFSINSHLSNLCDFGCDSSPPIKYINRENSATSFSELFK